jgi:hypothetical protein
MPLPSPTKRIKSLIEIDELEPTEEQAEIVQAARDGGDLVVQAYAGSGKTVTAKQIATATRAPGYFVVFSRAARRDAQSKMPQGMQATTGHALAFHTIVKNSTGYTKKLEAGSKNKGNQIPPALIIRHLDLQNRPNLQATAQQQAIAISATIREFEVSDSTVITPEHVPDQAIPANLRLDQDNDTKEIFVHFVTTQAGHIWREMESEYSGFPISHDTYLKILHLRQPYLSASLWLLDEYQDTTPVMDAIVQQQEGQKIYIGDPYQAIFGWRGAVDALNRPIASGARKLHLTQSFRFNHQIAGIANILLSSLGEAVPVKGLDYNLKQFNFHRHHTVLVRNNVKMLSVIGEYRAMKQSVYVAGGIPQETIIKATSAFALFANDPANIKLSMLRDLGSWSAFKDLAAEYEGKNPEYADLVHLVERYKGQLPDIIAYAQRPWDAIKNDPGRITLMTAHRSKGAEFAHVALRDDLAIAPSVIEKLQNGAPLTIPEREQVHLLYVAITRAKQSLSLPAKIRQNLQDLSRGNEFRMAELPGERSNRLNEQEIRDRTAAFIAKHKKPKSDESGAPT